MALDLFQQESDDLMFDTVVDIPGQYNVRICAESERSVVFSMARMNSMVEKEALSQYVYVIQADCQTRRGSVTPQ